MVRVLFMGTPDFAVPSLRALVTAGYDVVAVVTQPDRPAGRRRVPTPPAVKRAAEELGLPVWQPERIRDPGVLERVGLLKPDVAVTAAYGQILPQALLDLPPHGCLNVHASLLPKYRGAAPIQRCLMNGDSRTGVTIMKMVLDLDAGPVLAQESVPVEEDDDGGRLHDRLAELGARLLVDVLPRWLRGEVVPREQDESLATYAPSLKREDERLDWQRSARSLYNHIRALHPWPGAFTTFRGKILKVWKAEIAGPAPEGALPGEILGVDHRGVTVAAKDGTLRLLAVQTEGKTRLEAVEWARGQHIKPGETLGE
ncbi:MAG: methionyl-tRNA formyltransferase [Alicyclobacillaceae bacterium]|nr:methionyl-tRNA formyltransferase [Alicyclobacillaceae bacterium]